GASANDFIMQTQADVTDTRVVRPKMLESTAIGAAYLAGLAVGYWKNADEILENQIVDRTFDPCIDDKTRAEKLKGWERAVRAAQVG
ncbi:MAG: glycerol kinase, partial [Eubacterium sp.]|nr:glycerol kinase [Eubacterium sp.]